MKIGSSQSFSAKTTRWSSVQSPCWLMFVGSLFNIYIYIPASTKELSPRPFDKFKSCVYIYICIYLWVIIIIHDGNPLLWSHYNTFSAILNTPKNHMVHIFGTIWGWLILEWWDYNPMKKHHLLMVKPAVLGGHQRRMGSIDLGKWWTSLWPSPGMMAGNYPKVAILFQVSEFS